MKMLKIQKISYAVLSIVIIICFILAFDINIAHTDLNKLVVSYSSEEFSAMPHFNCLFSTGKNGQINYSPSNGNVQTIINLSGDELNSVIINFEDGLLDDTNFKIFYSNSQDDFKDEMSSSVGAKKGDLFVVLLLPKDKYTNMMLEADNTFSVEKLELGIGDDARILTRFYQFNILMMIILSIILVLLYVLRKKYPYYNALLDFFSSIFKKIAQVKFIKCFREYFFNKNDYITKKSSSTSSANWFTALAISFGLVLIYLVPPSSVCDECAHFQNICRIASGNFFVDKDNDQLGSFIDLKEKQFLDDTFLVFRNNTDKYSYQTIRFYQDTYKYANNEKAFYSIPTASINPMSYMSSIPGVFLAKYVFKFGDVYNVLIWARLSNLIFSIFVIRLAILKTPIMRNTMFLLALMPMTFYQLISVSYDAQAISGAFLLFAYGTKLILADCSYRITKQDLIAVCFSCACLSAAKQIYVICALILFAISIYKFGGIKKYIASIFSVAMMGVLFYLIPIMITNHLAGDVAKDPLLESQKLFLFGHLNLIPTIVSNSFVEYGNVYIKEFVGTFGWLNVPMPNAYIYGFMLILLLTGTFEMCLVRGWNIKARVLSLLAALIVVSGTIIAMYVNWTPWWFGINNPYASGVQGRYFIPVVLYLPLFFANPLLCKIKFVDRMETCIENITKYIAIAYLLLTCVIILTAYWL